jgi:hypothetical protein
LQGRVLEMTGQPLRTLRRLAEADAGVETGQMFGDRLHLRVSPGKADEVIARLNGAVASTPSPSTITRLRPVPTQLEDIFIALSEKGS